MWSSRIIFPIFIYIRVLTKTKYKIKLTTETWNCIFYFFQDWNKIWLKSLGCCFFRLYSFRREGGRLYWDDCSGEEITSSLQHPNLIFTVSSSFCSSYHFVTREKNIHIILYLLNKREVFSQNLLCLKWLLFTQILVNIFVFGLVLYVTSRM